MYVLAIISSSRGQMLLVLAFSLLWQKVWRLCSSEGRVEWLPDVQKRNSYHNFQPNLVFYKRQRILFSWKVSGYLLLFVGKQNMLYCARNSSLLSHQWCMFIYFYAIYSMCLYMNAYIDIYLYIDRCRPFWKESCLVHVWSF